MNIVSVLPSMQCACAILSYPAYPALQYFFHNIAKTARFSKKKKLLNIKCVFLFSLHLLFQTFNTLGKFVRNTIMNLHWSLSKVPVMRVRFYLNMNFLNRFSKNIHVPNFMKIRPVGAELFHADGQAHRQTYMTKLIIAFRNFVNAPKN